MSLRRVSYSDDKRKVTIEKFDNQEESIKLSFVYENTNASDQVIALSLYDVKLLATSLLHFVKEEDNG